MPQPLLIAGAPGRGQWAMAQQKAKTFLCEGNNQPCGFCVGCNTFDAGAHPDLWVLHDDNETISVDTARLLYDHTHQKPTRAKCRVVLIEHFDRATIAAQQCLLKLVEEPFVSTEIIFTTRDLNKILPTMRSRMAVLSLKPMSRDDFQQWCNTESIPYDEWLYDVTDGSPFLLKNINISVLMDLKQMLIKGEDPQSLIETLDRDIFYAAVYHTLAKQAKSTLDIKDFKRLDEWQALYQEVGASKSMNWAMQCRAFLI